MPERLLKFLLKFIITSIPLALLWLWQGANNYEKLFVKAVNFSSQLFLTNLFLPIPSTFFHNLVPFTALIIITPPLLVLRKLWQLVLGWVIIFLEHILVSLALYLFLDVWKLSESTYNWLFTPLSILSGTFPFVLWLVLLRQDIKSLFLKPVHSNSPR
ncbi:MAG: hypothetical protein A2142_05315 [candidate division Zixibacteria bacterium RBG_16_48_11]|nr:MAG: hypothetical protein A2142_05315 [candidate division Zixibacteria bacterium RBG_16_48_11]